MGNEIGILKAISRDLPMKANGDRFFGGCSDLWKLVCTYLHRGEKSQIW